ncbi:MAG: putative killer suppression protein HigA [Bacteroidetes bacterium]|nr:putative killer suppression protein HigA [Bacteroidota bacterium]
MEINYKTNKLKKTVASPRDIMANYGTRAKLVKQRLSEFEAATSLFDISLLPKANLHKLHGDKKGCLAVDISANYRIVFEPDHIPIPLVEDGGFNLKAIIKIRILSFEDYH